MNALLDGILGIAAGTVIGIGVVMLLLVGVWVCASILRAIMEG